MRAYFVSCRFVSLLFFSFSFDSFHCDMFSKRTENREIMAGKWTMKDKLCQYRGILKLHARQKKLNAQDAAKQKKRISWQLGLLRADVQKFRDILSGKESRVCTLLHHRSELRLRFRGRSAGDIYGAVYQDNCLKHRQLDKLRYEKEKKMRRCFELQSEHAELSCEHERERENPTDRVQQCLIARYQRSMSKQNAAKAIRSTYASMLAVLKKDVVYHETLLNALKHDQRRQCQIILKATLMGQLAAENVDDIGEKYKRMTRDVWNNMKERDRTLSVVRGQVDDLWTYAQSLIRTESDVNFTRGNSRVPALTSITLEKQIKSLEDVFDKVKESLLIRSYRDLFSRLEEQTRQRTRLLAQFERNVTERDSLLGKKNEALLTLSNMENGLVSTGERFNMDRQILLEQIEIQRKRENEQKSVRKVRGELLMDIRAALQNMVAILVCVKRGGKVFRRQAKDTDKKSTKESEEKEDMEDTEDQGAKIGAPTLEKMETDGLALLSRVSRKVGALFGMSNFELDRDKEDKARDLYQTYVSEYCSRLKFKDVEAEPTGFFVEHQAIDSSVPTRAEIKLRSKQMVETHLKLE